VNRDDFNKMLLECRIAARCTQEALGGDIHVDGSLISRFETTRTRPSSSTLQRLINALALRNVPRDKLDQLWAAAGYSRSEIFEAPVADPVVAFIQQEFEGLVQGEERELLSRELRSTAEIAQKYSSGARVRRARKWNQAGEELLVLRELLERRTQEWYVRIDGDLGQCRYGDGRYSEAIGHYESALWGARQLGDLRKQGAILVKLGDAHRRSGTRADWRLGLQRYMEARSIFLAQGDRIQEANCLRKIAGTYLFRGRPDRAQQLCDASLSICQEEDYQEGMYKALQHKAWACEIVGRWDSATQLNEEALAIVRTMTSDDWEVAKALIYLGDSQRIQRRITAAEESYNEALSILGKHQEAGVRVDFLTARVHLGLAKIYLKQAGRELQAKSLLNDSLSAFRVLGVDPRIAQVLVEQGDLLRQLHRFGEAEMRLQQAADRLRRSGNVFLYALALASLCELFYERGDFTGVHDTARTARRHDNGLVDYPLARIELTVGKTYVDKGEKSEARGAFGTAIDRALNFNEQTVREICTEILSEIKRVARKGESSDMSDAIELGEFYMRFWTDKQLVPGVDQRLVQEALNAAQHEMKAVRALAPVNEW
jgi:tetratricopeptide (TPR) repeat protein